ncbi:hypothetical protein FAM09_05115 [Niastella caeni]|uniref:DUF4369 domain-containing protein n=1 Tax=Niastella caeni TaxID=2569763 RepID=A0A4S8I0K9_9BACT|nr:hypothetical protein [Niastella caeni]THU41490.1 hypothetical protein FAM09_05115 [Niastella caeni]
MVKHVVFVLCFAALSASGKAQTNALAATPTIVKAGDVYNPFIENQSRLYNGIEHLGYSIRIKGHAYFLQKELAIGTIMYDELEFANVPMLYDLSKDQVIVQHLNGFSRLGLVSEKVKEFTLLNHHFIRLEADSLSRSPIFTGFYDELYSGQLKVLAKRFKYIHEEIKDELERKFLQQDHYFVQKDGVYYLVKTYKDLLTILKDKGREVKQYLRKNKIKFRKGRENAIVQATAYYDSLNK